MPSAASAALIVLSPPSTPVIATVVPRSGSGSGRGRGVARRIRVVDGDRERAVRGSEPGSSRCRCRRGHSGRHALTVTVEPPRPVPVITMPSAASAALIVLSPPSTPVIATVVPRSTVRVGCQVAVLPAASCCRTVTAAGRPSRSEPAG
jgi:hypothetical protein